MAISTKLHLLPIPSLAPNQGVMHESFIGDGMRDMFDLKVVPSSIGAMTARIVPTVAYPLGKHLVIGDVNLNTFFQVNAVGQGYDALVDVLAQDLYLRNALPQGETLVVEYPFGTSQQPSAMPAPDPNTDEPYNIPGWQPWDYQNWRDFQAAMHIDQPIEYAMCVWLMQNESNELAFQDGEWETWYRYARAHCPRFDREQPRLR